MPERGRVIVDTNTLVSAVLNASSIPAYAVDKALRTADLLRSIDTWHEVEDVLLRDKFERYQALAKRCRYLEYLFHSSLPISVHTQLSVCRHPPDDKFLELAVDGRADVIITGDKDLLTLHPFREIAILSPADYLAL